MGPVVVFGASGCEGRRVAEALVRRGVRTILGGRDAAKLHAVAAALGGAAEVRVADASDPGSLRDLVAGARAVISTVGPFATHGESLAEIALEAGVHYVDTTTEQSFQVRLQRRLHGPAKRKKVALLSGHACHSGFSALGAALLARRFGPLTSLTSFYDVGAVCAGQGSLKSRVTAFAGEALTFEGGRLEPMAPSPFARRTTRPGSKEPCFTVPFAGGDVALLPHEMPSLRAVSSHRVLPLREAGGAALGFASRPVLRPLLTPRVVALVHRVVDRGRPQVAAQRGARAFEITLLAKCARGQHLFTLRGPSAEAASAEFAALAGAWLAAGRATGGGVTTAGAALDPEAFLEALRPNGIAWSVETLAVPKALLGKHEVRTSAVANAPTAEVWARLLETNAWGRWNANLAGLKGDIREGERVKLMLQSPIGRKKLAIPVRVEAVEAGRELRWRGGFAPLLGGTHYFRLEPLDGQRTRITHGERFEGAVAAMSWPFIEGPLRQNYQDVTDALARQFL